MAITPTTLTLSNAGTHSVLLDSVGGVTPDSTQTFIGQFLPSSPGQPCYIVQAAAVITQVGGKGLNAYNEIGYCNLSSGTPFSIIRENAQTTVSGDVGEALGRIGVFGNKLVTWDVLAGGEGVAEGSALTVLFDSVGSGILVAQDSVATIPINNGLDPDGLIVQNGHLCLIVDEFGTIFDPVSGSYEAATFFPILNSPGEAPAYIGGTEAIWADTVGLQNYQLVNCFETVSPFRELAPIFEKTYGGTSSGVYTLAFNDTAIPGDVFNVSGYTPHGWFFIRQDFAALVAVDPVALTYTTYEFTTGDSIAAACLQNVFFEATGNAAQLDSLGSWWFCNAPSGQEGATVPTTYYFAKTSATVEGATIVLSPITAESNVSPTIGGGDFENPNAISMDYLPGTVGGAVGDWVTVPEFVGATTSGGPWSGFGPSQPYGTYTLLVRNSNDTVVISNTQTYVISPGEQETIYLATASGTLGGTVELTGTSNYGPPLWIDVSLDNGATWTVAGFYETASGTLSAPFFAVGPILTTDDGV